MAGQPLGDVHGVADHREAERLRNQVDEGEQRGPAVDEDRLPVADVLGRVGAGLALGRGVAVRRRGEFVGAVAFEVRRQHDVATEIGEPVGVVADVSPHRHLGDAEEMGCIPQVDHAALRERVGKGDDALGLDYRHVTFALGRIVPLRC